MFYEDVSYRVSVVFTFDFAMNVISKSRSCAAGDWVIVCWRYCLDQTGDRTDFNGIVTHVRISLSTQSEPTVHVAGLFIRRSYRSAISVRSNVRVNRHFAVGRVWARLLEPKLGPPQSVRLNDQLDLTAWEWLTTG